MSLTRRDLVGGLAALAPLAPALAAAPKSDPQLDRAAATALQRLVAGNQALQRGRGRPVELRITLRGSGQSGGQWRQRGQTTNQIASGEAHGYLLIETGRIAQAVRWVSILQQPPIFMRF